MGRKKAAAPPPVVPQKAESQFSGINNYTIDLGGFGSAQSRKVGDTISSSSMLNPDLQRIRGQAIEGLSGNLGYLNRTPTQQLQELSAGQNPFYNYQAEINRQNALEGYNELQARMSQSGLENSSVLGAFAGQQARDANLLDLATRQQSLDFLNQRALQNAGFGGDVLSQLAAYQQVPLELANQNLFQGFGNVDQTSMFNAQQMNQVAMQNAQLAEQARQAAAQRRSALLGNILGAGLSLAAIPLAGAFGPGAAIGSALARGVGGGATAGLGGLGGVFGAGSGSFISPFTGSLITPSFTGRRY